MISKIALRKLREIYLDENITIYLRDMNIVTVNEQQGEVKISPMIEGYVVDIDQDFYYLGLPDGSVIKTVPHDTTGLVEITFAGGEMLDLDMPAPDEDIH